MSQPSVAARPKTRQANGHEILNHGFETPSAPASLAATLRGFTFCVATPSSSAHGAPDYFPMSGMKGHVPLVTKLLLFVPEADLRRFAVSARTYRCYPRHPWLRVALNVPCFDARSPKSGANSTSPVIESGVSNFPFEQKLAENVYRRQRRTRRFLDTNPTAKPDYRRRLLLRAKSFGKCRS